MVLEATVVCLDNSEWMRNGDFQPSRLSAQADAVNLVCGAKMQPNPENSIGILTMSSRPDVLCTLTQDIGKILNCVHGVSINGAIKFLPSLQIAKLVLRHRANKNQRQRIVVFVGSPVEESEKELVKIAKALRKANVSVDIISFGEENNDQKLEAFIEAVNKDGGSHLVSVPGSGSVLSDILVTSPVLGGDGGSSFNEFGVDPNMDPDLAMALRISAEEERERQRLTRVSEDGEAPKEGVEATAPGGEETGGMEVDEDDEQMMLARAMAMSMEGGEEGGEDGMEVDGGGSGDTGFMTEEEQIALAMQMSLQESNAREGEGGEEEKEGGNIDSEFLSSVLDSLPGQEEGEEEKKE